MTMRERLDRKKRNKIWNNHHEAVLAMVIILLIAGLFNVFSSTFVMAERDCGTPYYYLKRHIISMVVEAIITLTSVLFSRMMVQWISVQKSTMKMS